MEKILFKEHSTEKNMKFGSEFVDFLSEQFKKHGIEHCVFDDSRDREADGKSCAVDFKFSENFYLEAKNIRYPLYVKNKPGQLFTKHKLQRLRTLDRYKNAHVWYLLRTVDGLYHICKLHELTLEDTIGSEVVQYRNEFQGGRRYQVENAFIPLRCFEKNLVLDEVIERIRDHLNAGL